MYGSRLFMPIMEIMREKVEPGSTNSSRLLVDPSYKAVLYSMHDTDIWSIFSWMQPEEGLPKNAEYASSFIYELHWDEKPGRKHYNVRVLYNGEPIKLTGCKTTMCTFDEFEKYIMSISFNYDEIEEECYKDPITPTRGIWETLDMSNPTSIRFERT